MMKNWVTSFLAATALILGAVVPAAHASHAYSEYDWITNPANGHQYAITFDYNTWVGAEAEAAAVGGHLATVRNAAENTWLSTTFQGYYARDYQGNSSASLVWIGLYQPSIAYHSYDPDRPNDWSWISGESVNPAFPFPLWSGHWSPPSGPGGDGGNHAYLDTDTHTNPGTWWNGNGADIDVRGQPRGIIELDSSAVPEPSTLIIWSLLGTLGIAVGWRRRK
jgi:hypothetical protein